ncbi:MAG: hypothetical protein PHF17_08350 [Arcobacteraceae bacterium]|nr:hypothetical protein [Arcobacteraceae bacterium]
MQPEQELNYKENTKITWNKIPAFLWRGFKTDDVEINEEKTHLKYVNVDSSIKKASILEIISLKYAPLLLLAWFVVYDVNLYFPSMTAVFLSIICYVGFLTYKDNMSRTSVVSVILLFPAAYLVYIFENKFQDPLELGAILNYLFQYILAIYFIHMVYKDFVNKGFEGYYSVKQKAFKFFKIVEESENISFSDKTKRQIEFVSKLTVSSIMTISFLFATIGIIHEVTYNNTVERVNAHMDITDTKSEKYLSHLDWKAETLKSPKWHRVDNPIFDGIEQYETIAIPQGSEYYLAFTTEATKEHERYREIWRKKHDYYFVNGYEGLKKGLHQREFLTNPIILKATVEELRKNNINVDDDFDYSLTQFYDAYITYEIKQFDADKKVAVFIKEDEYYYVDGNLTDFRVYKITNLKV